MIGCLYVQYELCTPYGNTDRTGLSCFGEARLAKYCVADRLEIFKNCPVFPVTVDAAYIRTLDAPYLVFDCILTFSSPTRAHSFTPGY
jgi:hypothetical protein